MVNQLKTVGLLGLLAAVVVGAGGVLAPSALPLFVALALAMNLGAYLYSDRIVLGIHDARALPYREAPEVHEMIRELAERAGIPAPELYVIPSVTPNAFATGRGPGHAAVAVTQGILRCLDRRELRGVLAHEIAHVVNRDVLIATVAAAFVAVVAYAVDAAQWALLLGLGSPAAREGEGGAAGGTVATMLVAPIAASLVQLAISRAREFEADRVGAALTGDPDGLAGALVRLEQGVARVPGGGSPVTASLFIVNPLRGGGMGDLFSTHPSTRERVRRLKEMAGTRRPPGRRFGRAA